MAQYRVQATFEITVTAEFTIEDAAETAADDVSVPVEERLMYRADVRAAEIMDNLAVTMYGCDTWELSNIDYTVYAIDAIE